MLENFIWEASLASRISINLGSIIPTPPPAVEILANLDKSASLTVFCDLSVWLKSQDVIWWELIPPFTETCLKARYWFPNSGNLLQFSWILQFWDLPFLKKQYPAQIELRCLKNCYDSKTFFSRNLVSVSFCGNRLAAH